jgi:hypothetical protein
MVASKISSKFLHCILWCWFSKQTFVRQSLRNGLRSINVYTITLSSCSIFVRFNADISAVVSTFDHPDRFSLVVKLIDIYVLLLPDGRSAEKSSRTVLLHRKHSIPTLVLETVWATVIVQRLEQCRSHKDALPQSLRASN